MLVLCAVPTLRLNQKQFDEISCRVTAHVFAIHRNFGRLFDERSYKQELADDSCDISHWRRCSG